MLVNEKKYLTTLSLPTISPPCPSLYPLSTLSPPLPHPSGSAEKDPKNQALASALTTFMKQAGVRVTSALMERTPSFMNKDKRGLPKFPRSTRKVRASIWPFSIVSWYHQWRHDSVFWSACGILWISTEFSCKEEKLHDCIMQYYYCWKLRSTCTKLFICIGHGSPIDFLCRSIENHRCACLFSRN